MRKPPPSRALQLKYSRKPVTTAEKRLRAQLEGGGAATLQTYADLCEMTPRRFSQLCRGWTPSLVEAWKIQKHLEISMTYWFDE